jgi:hypothetical protein
MSKDSAGLEIASLWVVVMRGTNCPCVVLLTSSIAELSAAAPVALIAKPCEKQLTIDN